MKNYFSSAVARLLLPVLVAGAALGTASCSKNEPAAVVNQDFSAADDATIQKYLADNKITNARKQSSGLYYVPVSTNPNGQQATQEAAPRHLADRRAVDLPIGGLVAHRVK